MLDRVGSTSDEASRAAGDPSAEGLVVLAEEQTAGRGRRGRRWSAPAGSSVLLSVLLYPTGPLAGPPWLTALGAIAAAEVVEAATGRAAGIKWPNDVRVEGRKVAGVLVERGRGVVVGIGLNVHHRPGDFPPALAQPAASLAMLAPGPLDRSELARDLIRGLDRWYGRGLGGDLAGLDEAWRSRFEPLGRPVRLETGAGRVLVGRLTDAGLGRGLLLEPAEGGAVRVPCLEVAALSAAG